MKLDSALLRNRLKLKSIASERKLLESHATAKKFFENAGIRPGQIRQHATKLLSSGLLASSLLLSNPISITHPQKTYKTTASQSFKMILPEIGNWDLTIDQENQISQKIKEAYGVNAVAQLDGNRLPNSYGRMGAEQHLARFPGDYVSNMAPGLGGWGYFAWSQNDLTNELIQTEKYYVAAQTLYIPDWKEKLEYYVKWYQYRRVIVINPENGKAIITSIADAGPSQYTGKHFGGSPEVMEYLKINTGMQNHPVIFFFLDDPKKEIPLGPLDYNIPINQI